MGRISCALGMGGVCLSWVLWGEGGVWGSIGVGVCDGEESREGRGGPGMGRW